LYFPPFSSLSHPPFLVEAHAKAAVINAGVNAGVNAVQNTMNESMRTSIVKIPVELKPNQHVKISFISLCLILLGNCCCNH